VRRNAAWIEEFTVGHPPIAGPADGVAAQIQNDGLQTIFKGTSDKLTV